MSLSLGANTLVLVVTAAVTGALPGPAGKYLLTTNTDCFVRFDGDVASKTVFDLFMPAGAAIVVSPGSGLNLSVIRDIADGTLVIQEVL